MGHELVGLERLLEVLESHEWNHIKLKPRKTSILKANSYGSMDQYSFGNANDSRRASVGDLEFLKMDSIAHEVGTREIMDTTNQSSSKTEVDKLTENDSDVNKSMGIPTLKSQLALASNPKDDYSDFDLEQIARLHSTITNSAEGSFESSLRMLQDLKSMFFVMQ